MKKTLFLALLAVLSGWTAPAQPSGDTIDFMPRHSEYYYNDWWADRWADTTNGQLYLSAEIGGGLRYNFTDQQLTIVGLAAALFVEDLREHVCVYDTMETGEYLLLCDAYPDSFVTVARIPWHIRDSHSYIRLSLFSRVMGTTCCRGGDPEDVILPLYTYYFDKPVTVRDSFYIGSTANYINPSPLEYPSYFPRYDARIYALQGPYMIHRFGCSGACAPFIQKYRVDSMSYPTFNWYSPLPFHCDALDFYSLIFPIVEYPECRKVGSTTVEEVDSGGVVLRWSPDSLHASWEVAWGLAGFPPESCRIIQCSSPEAVLDSVERGVRYVAYVRGVCEHVDSVYYSDWSPAVGIFLPILYDVAAEANYPERGSVTGGGTYEEGHTAVLTAQAWRPYRFRIWDDGDTNNPRRVVVTQDTAFTAIFVNPEGIEETPPYATKFLLLPNPAGSEVRCVLHGTNTTGATLTLVDVTGHEILRQTLPTSATETILHVETLPNGVYYVTLTTSQGTSTQKLVVER